jgi:rhodanese-related sulfurtransferase
MRTLLEQLGTILGRVRGRQIDADQLMIEMQSLRPPLLLDVRSARQYAEVHLPGAIHVPFDRLVEAAGLLDRARPVVVY